jgi:hypothetical protein
MRAAGLHGACRRRAKGCTVGDPAASPHPDLVNRKFTTTGPDRLQLSGITQHRTGEGWVCCGVVLDAWSRRVIGWSIADHLRTELVTDALAMARLRRRPTACGGTVLHSDHGCQYTSRAFGQRLRQAGLLGSHGQHQRLLRQGVGCSGTSWRGLCWNSVPDGASDASLLPAFYDQKKGVNQVDDLFDGFEALNAEGPETNTMLRHLVR